MQVSLLPNQTGVCLPMHSKASLLIPDCGEGSEVKITQSCPTLCEPMDYTIHGVLQARILEWVAFPFSRVVKESTLFIARPTKDYGQLTIKTLQWILGKDF